MSLYRITLAAIALCTPAADASAQEVRLSKAVRPGHEIVIFGHARWNDECGMKEIGEVYLDKAPTHGVVCTRIVDIRVRQMFSGTARHCLGHVVRGVQVVYLARSGAVGRDEADYTVRYETHSRTVGVTIDVRADHPTARGVVPKDIAEPSPGYVQPLGRIPPCTALVS